MKAKEDWLSFTGRTVKSTLSEPERKLFQQAVDKLIVLSEENKVDKTHVIIYGGNKYSHSSLSSLGSKAKTLNFNLMPEFNNALYQWKEVTNEMQQIWQSLLPLCRYASPQNIRNSLPEELIQSIKILNEFPRTQQHNEVLEKLSIKERAQYEKMLPRLHYYLSLRMLV